MVVEEVVKLEPEKIEDKRMALRLGRYVFHVFKRGKGGKTKYTVDVVAVSPEKLPTGSLRDFIENHIEAVPLESLEATLEEYGDEFLKAHAGEIATAIAEYVAGWRNLLLYRETKDIFIKRIDYQIEGRTPLENQWRGINEIATSLLRDFDLVESDKERLKAIFDKEELTLEDISAIISIIVSPVHGELFEVEASTGLTLKLVDRSRGLVNLRPCWTLIASPPSGLKTAVMKLIARSPYVLELGNVTAASLLPAKPEQPALVEQMHNRVTLFPTLSMIAEKDPKEAREIFAVLESIYDGKYRRDTAEALGREAYVDTSIIGAITLDVFEAKLLKPMVSYGSRWLIYRFNIPDELALKLAHLLETEKMQRVMLALSGLASHYFTAALENIGYDDFQRVQFPGEYWQDLDILAELLAKLRVSFHRDRYYDEEQRKYVEEFNVTQHDIPIRARLQLSSIIRANVLIRKVPLMLGLPTVDKHAMRLAAKLALGSSSKYMADILLELTRRDGNISQRDLADLVRVSQPTVNRYVNVLYQVGILEDTAYPVVNPRYQRVITKYLLEDGDNEAT